MAQAATAEVHGHEHDAHDHGPQGIMKYLWSTDHKIIAMQYLFTGMFMAIVGGYMAYAFRMQLAFPGVSVPGFEGPEGLGGARARTSAVVRDQSRHAASLVRPFPSV